MIDRRQLMMSAAAAAAAGGIAYRLSPWAAAAAALPEIDLAAPVVDVHCHIFNSADLPVFGFVKQSVFQIYGDQQQVGGVGAPPCRERGQDFPLSAGPLTVFAMLLDRAMSNALDAAAEADELSTGIAAADPGATSMASDLQTIFGPEPDIAPAGPKSRLQVLIEQEFRTHQEYEAAREALEQQIARDSGADPSVAADDVQAAFLGAASDSFTGRHMNWAKRMITRRAKHASEIATMYSGKVRLFTPALIDYSKWLNDEPKSDLKSQIAVMEQISAQAASSRGAKFHGFIAFDPLRDVHERGAALSLVKEAVTTRGFLGVKLYPPMGFKPIANASDPALTFPAHALTTADGRRFNAAGLAFALDERLRALYQWCQQNDVPVLSHAANSQGAGPCYGERANTANWRPVAAAFPSIRLCLAHVGSFDAAREANGRLNPANSARLEASWEWSFGRLVTDGAPNIYGDLSYFHELLISGEADREAMKAAFVKLLQTFPALVDRLIYGSDWLMLDREPDREEHLKAVFWFMAEVLEAASLSPADARTALKKMFATNAVRFLGLEADKPTGRRLTAFYGRVGVANPERVLDEFRPTR